MDWTNWTVLAILPAARGCQDMSVLKASHQTDLQMSLHLPGRMAAGLHGNPDCKVLITCIC